MRGIERMTRQTTLDILTQVSAVTKAPAGPLGLLDEHMSHCVLMPPRQAPDAETKLREASEAIARLVRS